ncbi:MAG: cytochrome c3 family protein [Candidatus Methylomirabilales bacterium]
MMSKFRMLPLMLLGLSVIAIGAVPEAMAAGIVGSKHDLSTGGTAPSWTTTKLGLPPANEEVCIFCHTPHAAADPSVAEPLWNRDMTTQTTTYTLYNSSTFDSNFAAGFQKQPFGVSKACLSCHDGTVGFNALLNNRGPLNPAPTGTDTTMPDGITRIAEGGTNLTNDHPISMRYSQANSPSGTDGTDNHATGFYAEFTSGTREYVNKGATTVDVSALPLYSDGASTDFVQCGTCHDPHREAIGTQVNFLRKSNDMSALCLTCHKKDG